MSIVCGWFWELWKPPKGKTSFTSLFGMMIASWHHLTMLLGRPRCCKMDERPPVSPRKWMYTGSSNSLHFLPVKKWEWAKTWYAKGTATLWPLIQNFHDQSADVAGCHQRIRYTFFFKHANSCQFNFIWENHRKSVTVGEGKGNSSQICTRNRRRLKGAPCWIAHRAPQLGSTSCRAKIGFELSQKW